MPPPEKPPVPKEEPPDQTNPPVSDPPEDPNTAPQAIDVDDALIEEPRDDAFEKRPNNDVERGPGPSRNRVP
jgi:hypothetical protein